MRIFLSIFRKSPLQSLWGKKNWDYKKIKKYKRCLCCSAHCLYPDIMKLCIQNPVVMEFHSRMGTVNAATLNVGRLLYKGQLSHWEGWQLDRGPTNEYTERHNESSFTLPPPSPDTLRQTSHHNNQCPPLCLRERKATERCTVPGERQSQSQQKFSFTGPPWLHRDPQQGHMEPCSILRVQGTPKPLLTTNSRLEWRWKTGTPIHSPTKPKHLRGVYLRGGCWDANCSLKPSFVHCVISPLSECYWSVWKHFLYFIYLILRTEIPRGIKSYKAERLMSA